MWNSVFHFLFNSCHFKATHGQSKSAHIRLLFRKLWPCGTMLPPYLLCWPHFSLRWSCSLPHHLEACHLHSDSRIAGLSRFVTLVTLPLLPEISRTKSLLHSVLWRSFLVAHWPNVHIRELFVFFQHRRNIHLVHIDWLTWHVFISLTGRYSHHIWPERVGRYLTWCRFSFWIPSILWVCPGNSLLRYCSLGKLIERWCIFFTRFRRNYFARQANFRIVFGVIDFTDSKGLHISVEDVLFLVIASKRWFRVHFYQYVTKFNN